MSNSWRTRILAALVLVATFAAGALAGIVAHRHFMRRSISDHGPMRVTKFMVERLDKRLDLTPAQRADVERILTQRHRRMAELRRGLEPQIRREIELANGEIEQVLTPEQRRIFKEMKMRLLPRAERAREPRPPRR